MNFHEKNDFYSAEYEHKFQDHSIFSASAKWILQSCTKPLIHDTFTPYSIQKEKWFSVHALHHTSMGDWKMQTFMDENYSIVPL